MKTLTKKLTKASAGKIAIGLVFLALVILPLIKMLSNFSVQTAAQVFSSSVFLASLKNSVASTAISTFIVLLLAFLLAVSIQRSNIKFKKVFSFLFVIPMLIPSISHGMSLTILFGNNGIITNMFALETSIYGLKGIIAGSVLYAFPVAFLMFNDVLKYEDMSQYEAAMVLGIPKLKQFKAITLPYIKKPFLSVAFAVFTMIITDYGVPLMIGGKTITLPVLMYQEVIGQLDFKKGTSYALVLLVPALISFLLDLLNKENSNRTYLTKKLTTKPNRAADILSYIFVSTVSVLTILPVIAFGALMFATRYPGNMAFTLNNIFDVLNIGAGKYLLNSVAVAIFVGVFGSVIAFFTAYLSSRMKSPASRFLHLTAITSAAIPGIVLGLSYTITFNASAIYGTIIILVMVNLVHFVSTPYLTMYNAMNKLNKNLEDVGLTLGIPRSRIIKNVILPQSAATIFEIFSYFFINSMMTISAVSFLATTSNKPISLMITQFEAQMQLEFAAVASIMILSINIIMKITSEIIKKKFVEG